MKPERASILGGLAHSPGPGSDPGEAEVPPLRITENLVRRPFEQWDPPQTAVCLCPRNTLPHRT